MAHGNKTMPLDRYPYMDNDLKSKVGDFVTHEELNTILTDYVSNDNFENYKNTITSELTDITDSIINLNNSVGDLLAFSPLSFDITGCNSELSLDDNLQILYNYMETKFTKGDTEIKTFFVQSDFARFILEDNVSNCLMVLIKRYNPNKTKFSYLGFVKNILTGFNYTPINPNNTNYIYVLTDSSNYSAYYDYPTFVPVKKLWGNDYIPT